MEGQLKERSEGVKAQWQTALGVVVAAGLDLVIKLATASIAHCVPRTLVPSSEFRVPSYGKDNSPYYRASDEKSKLESVQI